MCHRSIAPFPLAFGGTAATIPTFLTDIKLAKKCGKDSLLKTFNKECDSWERSVGLFISQERDWKIIIVLKMLHEFKDLLEEVFRSFTEVKVRIQHYKYSVISKSCVCKCYLSKKYKSLIKKMYFQSKSTHCRKTAKFLKTNLRK